ncbi:MAG: Rrf2 family transcriptional regulator [Anaerolineae bacterium]|nr:Rrf2 family transcriptional regulator [Phycisphaerae bacterium]
MISIAQTSAQDQPARAGGAHRRSNGHARNRAGNGNAARAVQISESTGVPVEYLRKVLQRLTRARLVASERGRGGGFRLARPADRITLLNIVEAIEGPVDEAAFLGDGILRGPKHRNPRLREWRRVTALGVRGLLDAQSLADLAE